MVKTTTLCRIIMEPCLYNCDDCREIRVKVTCLVLGTITATIEAHCLFETDLSWNVLRETQKNLKKIHVKAENQNKMSFSILMLWKMNHRCETNRKHKSCFVFWKEEYWRNHPSNQPFLQPEYQPEATSHVSGDLIIMRKFSSEQQSLQVLYLKIQMNWSPGLEAKADRYHVICTAATLLIQKRGGGD